MTYGRILVVTLALLAIGAAAQFSAAFMANDRPPVVSFIRPPTFLGEGYQTDIRLRIPRDDANRWVELYAYETGTPERDHVSYSRRDLDGRSAPLQVFQKLIFPPGSLVIVGQLWGVSGVRGRVTHPLRVLSKDGQEDDLADPVEDWPAP